jgi:hypothetical protein
MPRHTVGYLLVTALVAALLGGMALADWWMDPYLTRVVPVHPCTNAPGVVPGQRIDCP